MSKVLGAVVLGLVVLFPSAASQAAPEGDAEAGAQLYKDQNCTECHGDKGKGDGYILPMLKVKPEIRDWTDKAVMSPMTNEYLAEIIAKGGEALGKSDAMLPYSHKLNDQQIKDLVAYIRSLVR